MEIKTVILVLFCTQASAQLLSGIPGMLGPQANGNGVVGSLKDVIDKAFGVIEKKLEEITLPPDPPCKVPERCNPEGGDPEGGDPKDDDPEGGDPEAGDPEAGDPEAGDPEGGDPEGGDPEGGDPGHGSSASGDSGNSEPVQPNSNPNSNSGSPQQSGSSPTDVETHNIALPDFEFTSRGPYDFGKPGNPFEDDLDFNNPWFPPRDPYAFPDDGTPPLNNPWLDKFPPSDPYVFPDFGAQDGAPPFNLKPGDSYAFTDFGAKPYGQDGDPAPSWKYDPNMKLPRDRLSDTGMLNTFADGFDIKANIPGGSFDATQNLGKPATGSASFSIPITDTKATKTTAQGSTNFDGEYNFGYNIEDKLNEANMLLQVHGKDGERPVGKLKTSFPVEISDTKKIRVLAEASSDYNSNMKWTYEDTANGATGYFSENTNGAREVGGSITAKDTPKSKVTIETGDGQERKIKINTFDTKTKTNHYVEVKQTPGEEAYPGFGTGFDFKGKPITIEGHGGSNPGGKAKVVFDKTPGGEVILEGNYGENRHIKLNMFDKHYVKVEQPPGGDILYGVGSSFDIPGNAVNLEGQAGGGTLKLRGTVNNYRTGSTTSVFGQKSEGSPSKVGVETLYPLTQDGQVIFVGNAYRDGNNNVGGYGGIRIHY